MNDERNKEALKQARAQLDSIREWFDAAQDARDGLPVEVDGYEIADEEEARDRAQEQALSVEVRCTEWLTPGDDYAAGPDEFRIIVCTGGPHVEIRGTLNKWSEPEDNAEIYGQDWFTHLEPLQGLSEADREALDWFCRLFYFGE